MSKPRAIFLDRDGTVIHDKSYLDTVEGVELLPGAVAGLQAMVGLGYTLVLVTNQSGVGRGYFAVDVVHAQYDRLQELLAPHGVAFKAMEVCPHAPGDGCSCRKPLPGMLLSAADKLGIETDGSFMIGDKEADVLAGQTAGCRSIRIHATPLPDSAADVVVSDLTEAAAWISSVRGHA